MVRVHPVIALKALFCIVWSACLLVAEVFGYQDGDAQLRVEHIYW